MKATKVTWTHEALAEAEKHGFDITDRHWAELHACAGEKDSEIIVTENDCRFVYINRTTLRHKA